MRLIALLILRSPAFAAPVPEQPEKPGVELKLSADNQNGLEITIQNNGKEPLELPYRVTPFEHFVVELRGENGIQYKIAHTGKTVDKAESGPLTVPAGKSKTLSVHTCHFLPALGESEQKVTFIARLKHDGKTIESKPLTVNPLPESVAYAEPSDPGKVAGRRFVRPSLSRDLRDRQRSAGGSTSLHLRSCPAPGEAVIHKCVFAIAVWLLCSLPANANNNLFLPGDSFFPTSLSHEELVALAEADNVDRTFTYSSLGGYPGTLCGFAGYDVAKFTQVDDAFVKNLRHVYDKIRQYDFRTLTERREDGEMMLTESNPVGVLFYRSDFEFGRGKLGLRYNENWVQQTARFGYEPTHVRLCCLIDHPDAVMLSWRDAERFPALDIVEPDVDLKPGKNELPGKKVTAPVTVTSNIKAFVIGSNKPADFFRPSEKEAYMMLYIVDSDGVQELEYVDGKWAPPEEDDRF